MQVFHKPSAVSASFDDANFVSSAGLLPVMTLARDAGLHELADERLAVPTEPLRGFRTAELVNSSTLPRLAVDDHSGLR
jgi:hypothetical protein